jgi:hypothetical protein
MRWYGCKVALPTIGLVLAMATTAFGQNTTAGGAVHLTVGQVYHQSTVDGANTQRWFVFPAIVGRSYCVEVVAAPTQEIYNGSNDPQVSIYLNDATTLVTSNFDIGNSEPGGIFNARSCWTAAGTTSNFIKAEPSVAGSTATYAIRLVETTLFSNWFFLGGDYSAYTLLRNTTNATVSYTINWRNGAGAIVATQSATLAANASTFVDARSKAGALSAVSGTVDIAHNGSMDAIMATTTVLSATTGLSFDTIFVKRTAW